MLNDALRYLKIGWSVIPTCWPVAGACGCGRNHQGNDIGKAPLIQWAEYQKRLPTVEEVTKWWTQWPHANISGITGALSNLVVIDLEHDGLAEAERRALWSPLKVFTGKGYHLYFSHPGEGRVCNAAAMKADGKNRLKGFDLRGDGGYVLLPPSLHQTGRRYTLASAYSVGAPLPVFQFGLIAATIPGAASQPPSQKPAAKPAGWIAEALAGLAEGNRDTTFAQIIGKLHSQRWGASDIRSLLLPHALRVQYSEMELDKTIRSISRYPVNITSGGGKSTVGVPVPGEPTPKLSVRTFERDWADYERRKSGEKSGEFATGYPRFDALLNGGLIKERLLTVAARTGIGKTNWLLGVCRNLCVRGKRVLYLSTELSYKKIWDRYIALFGAEEEARKHSLIVSDEFIPNPEAIREAIIDHKPDVFIFDHIHNVSEENSEVGAYIKMLAQYAKDFQIPGIVAAQLNKDAYWIDRETGKRITPHLGMIKGASAIIQISGQVLILDEQDETPEQRDLLGVLDKNSDGEKGLVSFVLKKHPYRMEEA